MGFDGLGAYVSRSVGARPLPDCCLMQLVGIDIKKWGEGHPPPSAMIVRSGGATPASLLPPSSAHN